MVPEISHEGQIEQARSSTETADSQIRHVGTPAGRISWLLQSGRVRIKAGGKTAALGS